MAIAFSEVSLRSLAIQFGSLNNAIPLRWGSAKLGIEPVDDRYILPEGNISLFLNSI